MQGLTDHCTIPPVFNKSDKTQIDEDLSLALTLWFLENEREKGSGFIRKKIPERVSQVSIVYRPLLILRHSSAMIIFDGCGI